MDSRVCFHCLCPGHIQRDCSYKKDVKCGINDCSRYHNRLLHQDKESGLLTIEEYLKQAKIYDRATVTSESAFFTKGDQYDAIRTIPAYIVSPTGQRERIWVALDSCSTSTNIDADTARRLNLKIEQTSIDRSIGVLQSSVSLVSDRVSFTLQTLDGRNICWLSKDYIWGFAGPVACVIIFNLYILFTGLKVANKVNLG